MDIQKQGYVYILFNYKNGTLYVGVTSDLVKRVYEHKTGMIDGFTKKYGLDKLGYYEIHETMHSAIEREKQIKSWRRKKKLELINRMNPNWDDLYEAIA